MPDRMIAHESDSKPPVSRRDFIKGVIATGAVATSASYLFRNTGPVLGQPSTPSSVERSG